MMTITEEQKKELIAINELVKKEEIKAVTRYEILEKELKEMAEIKSVWDYNLEMKLCCFTSSEALNIKYNTDEGNPFFKWNGAIYDLLISRKENPDWSEVDYLRGTLLDGFRFCYTFYCILCYSNLSIKEILLIQAILIEISIDYQWEVELIKITE